MHRWGGPEETIPEPDAAVGEQAAFRFRGRGDVPCFNPYACHPPTPGYCGHRPYSASWLLLGRHWRLLRCYGLGTERQAPTLIAVEGWSANTEWTTIGGYFHTLAVFYFWIRHIPHGHSLSSILSLCLRFVQHQHMEEQHMPALISFFSASIWMYRIRVFVCDLFSFVGLEEQAMPISDFSCSCLFKCSSTCPNLNTSFVHLHFNVHPPECCMCSFFFLSLWQLQNCDHTMFFSFGLLSGHPFHLCGQQFF